MKVAFLGLGRMGTEMAENVIKGGHVLTVWNRTPEKAVTFANNFHCRKADIPAEAVHGVDVAITMLADDSALNQTYHGRDGVIAGLTEGVVTVDMGTSSPMEVRELARVVSERGATMLDAPVSGSVTAAASGNLTIMVGGDRIAYERVVPVLNTMGAKIFYLGESGNGSVVKLAVNIIVHSLNCAISEALVLAEKAGIDRHSCYEVFRNSAIAAPLVHYRQKLFEYPSEKAVAFRMLLAEKDLRLAEELAVMVGARLPQGECSRSAFSEAIAAGFGEEDESALAEYLRQG